MSIYSLRWPIYIFNLVDTTKLKYSSWHRLMSGMKHKIITSEIQLKWTRNLTFRRECSSPVQAQKREKYSSPQLGANCVAAIRCPRYHVKLIWGSLTTEDTNFQFEKLPLHSGLDYQPLFRKGACTSLPSMTGHVAEHMDMALLILINKKSAYLQVKLYENTVSSFPIIRISSSAYFYS